MSSCLFCKIAKNEIPSEIVFEDSDVKVFKDLHPKAPVHLLVIPKMHIQSIAHLDPVRSKTPGASAIPPLAEWTSNRVEADHGDIIAKLIYTAKKVAEELDLKGYKLVFNVGREGGQVIDHLHLHLLGGWKSKEGRSLNV